MGGAMRSPFTFWIALSCVIIQAGVTRADESEKWTGTTNTQKLPTTVEKKDTSITVTISPPEGSKEKPIVITAPLTASKEIQKEARVKWYDQDLPNNQTWPGQPKHFGYLKVFEIATLGECMKWRFVQLKNFRVTWIPSNETQFPGPGAKEPNLDVDIWEVDGNVASNDPGFDTLKGLPQGETATIDIPGSFDTPPTDLKPWQQTGHKSQHIKTIFRTWIQCLNPKGTLGYLQWALEMDRTPKAYSGLKTTPPKWHDASEEPEEKERLDRIVEKMTK
jgi:hypothetical protein